VQPAIDLAAKGFCLTKAEASGLNFNRNDFLKYNTRPTAFLRDRPWKEGDTLFQPELAATLTRIRDQGMKGFYEGETARLIAEEMARGGGLITLQDLKDYTAKERETVRFPYKGNEIVSMPLPSSGGLILQQTLKMLEGRDLPKMGFHSPSAVQLIVEAERRAYADRAMFMGDRDFVKVPVKSLVKDSYLEGRMKDFVPGKAGSSETTKAGAIDPESEETTHLSVADRWGNAVAVTTTLNGGYGSKTVVGGAGYVLGPVLGAFLLKLLGQLLPAQEAQGLFYGGALILLLLIGAPFVWLQASQEAAAFNRFTTGPKATTWDALWVELRVEADR
jgi:gamma-glutamyltranspeptidase/glutathione hydrolase